MDTILLQAQSTGSGAQWPQFIFFGAIILIFYFFMIRPQQKKAKDQKKFTDEVKKGDYVVTIGGAHGHIAEMEGDTFILEVEKGGRIRFNKSAISMEATKASSKK
ncbi:MAG TPA: preprotein translocase subunit YajC [Cyclobacteriaceae bacterium]|nr:preprotein translocase subunit YajC [Cyclobacteriaceae bacterium]